jgi:hypothetical protein
MMGCPKFDDTQDYMNRFADIFKIAGIKSVATVIMEVPCCSGLPMIVKKGMEAAGEEIPMEEVVLSIKGKIINQKRVRISSHERRPRSLLRLNNKL